MEYRPRHKLRIFRNGGQYLVGKFLGIDQNAIPQPVASGDDQLARVYQQVGAGDYVIVPNGKATEGDIDSTVDNRSKLIYNGELDPFQRYVG
jgi:hypothetical protein